MVKKELLEILVCPKCHAELEYRKEHEALICRPCKIAFPVREDIPVMLLDEALELQDEGQ